MSRRDNGLPERYNGYHARSAHDTAYPPTAPDASRPGRDPYMHRVDSPDQRPGLLDDLPEPGRDSGPLPFGKPRQDRRHRGLPAEHPSGPLPIPDAGAPAGPRFPGPGDEPAEAAEPAAPPPGGLGPAAIQALAALAQDTAPAAGAEAPEAARAPEPPAPAAELPPSPPPYPAPAEAPRAAFPGAAPPEPLIEDASGPPPRFRPDPVPDAVVTRVLEAAHRAPAMGLAQPWDFLIVTDPDTRRELRELAREQALRRAGRRARARGAVEEAGRGITEAPVSVIVTVDPTRGTQHTAGRHAQPRSAGYSATLAVSNLWQAARAEGLGLGWVTFFDDRELAERLAIPAHLEVAAFLCVGYADAPAGAAEPAAEGAAPVRPLSWAVHNERYGRRGLPGTEPRSLVAETLALVRPPDEAAARAARERLDRMAGAEALGALGELAERLAGLAGPAGPDPAALVVFAADHGVAPAPPGPPPVPHEGSLADRLARRADVDLVLADVGLAGEPAPGLLPRRVGRGTADITAQPAMTRDDALRAAETGIELAADLVAAGSRALLTGEPAGAGSAASTALVAVLTGREAAEVHGPRPVDPAGAAAHDRALEAAQAALRLHRPDAGDPLGVLAAVGGFEHAALAGLVLGAAALRVPVLLDGAASAAAACLAVALCPDAAQVCVAAHRAVGGAQPAALAHLGLRPLAELRLGAGGGAGPLLALPLLRTAAGLAADDPAEAP
ncbi:5,6-dimethylbenzimidazole synthase [Allonocardiopsis opalescens]|uniref:Nicotinate-nucleotide--dimethylbenzimidazole phosphoribosyltransferase n=1 Tax=Allonocardiopsis opalescens TaxID=1144618 RepID=A0A2T0PXJ2_9ACTN|nr:5,6-dimethylbenzimidazole synthase [Allonocardiopsis opalescens]PRX96250.1 cob(II)yrinic acid a,c-diamide reductase [Allonocardiopsis opalescens]